MIRRPPRSPRTDTLLPDTTLGRAHRLPRPARHLPGRRGPRRAAVYRGPERDGVPAPAGRWRSRRPGAARHRRRQRPDAAGRPGRTERAGGAAERSEEHTSELQSLMRISYAVFCLKKKNLKFRQKTILECNIEEN